MILLVLGLLVWALAHWFRRLAPDRRAAMGDAGKGLVALLVVVALLLMIFGYRWAPFVPVWTPPAWTVHLNNLLMVAAFWAYGSSAAKGPKAFPANRTRHPQLLGFGIWATAHRLVNGDLASIVLFGGLLVWAVVSALLINRAEPHWVAPPHAGSKTYIRLAVITAVVFAIVTTIHAWLGVWPFGG